MSKKIQIVKQVNGKYTARHQRLFCWVYLTRCYHDMSLVVSFDTQSEAKDAAIMEWCSSDDDAVVEEFTL